MKQPQHFYISALVENASGNLELAHTLAARGLEAALDAENTYAERELLYPLARAEAWLGREQEARATAQRLCEEASTHGVKPLLVRAASVLGLLALHLRCIGPDAKPIRGDAHAGQRDAGGHARPQWWQRNDVPARW